MRSVGRFPPRNRHPGCTPAMRRVASTFSPQLLPRGYWGATRSTGGVLPMLTLWGSRQRFCDGISRRNFLQIGAFGAGLTLADMLRARAVGGSTVPSHKAAIMIYLPGGPSHMDMYDMKPAAPKEFR